MTILSKTKNEKLKRVLLNASMVADQSTGVAVYSIQVIQHLIPLLHRAQVTPVVYTYNCAAFKEVSCEIRPITLGIFDRLLKRNVTLHRHVWNLFCLNFLANGFNLVFSPSSHGALFLKKQIITIHDLICLTYPEQHKSQYYYFKSIVPFISRRSRGIIAISEFTKKEILLKYSSKLAKKVKVIYNGVDHFLGLLEPSEYEKDWVQVTTNGKTYCLIVGISYPHKNLETLLKVADKLRETDVTFVMVGRDTRYVIELKKLAKKMDLQNVLYLSYVSNKQLAALYKYAKLNVYLSLYEGFGFPPAEALFFGTPSLISRQPSLLEVYGNCFPSVEPTNVEEIVKKIEAALNQSSPYPCSFNQLKEKYNWSKCADEVFSLILKNID